MRHSFSFGFHFPSIFFSPVKVLSLSFPLSLSLSLSDPVSASEAVNQAEMSGDSAPSRFFCHSLRQELGGGQGQFEFDIIFLPTPSPPPLLAQLRLFAFLLYVFGPQAWYMDKGLQSKLAN